MNNNSARQYIKYDLRVIKLKHKHEHGEASPSTMVVHLATSTATSIEPASGVCLIPNSSHSTMFSPSQYSLTSEASTAQKSNSVQLQLLKARSYIGLSIQ